MMDRREPDAVVGYFVYVVVADLLLIGMIVVVTQRAGVATDFRVKVAVTPNKEKGRSGQLAAFRLSSYWACQTGQRFFYRCIVS